MSSELRVSSELPLLPSALCTALLDVYYVGLKNLICCYIYHNNIYDIIYNQIFQLLHDIFIIQFLSRKYKM